MITQKEIIEPDTRDFEDIPREEGRKQSAQLLLFLLSAHGDKFTKEEKKVVQDLVQQFSKNEH